MRSGRIAEIPKNRWQRSGRVCVRRPVTRWPWGLAGVCLLAALPRLVHAEDLVAVHPGLMCRSASVLEKLTRDDGSVRTEGHHAPAWDILKVQGDCLDVGPGLRVTAVKVHVGTSDVTCDIGGLPQRFTIANVDFAPAPAAAGSGSDATSALPGGAAPLAAPLTAPLAAPSAAAALVPQPGAAAAAADTPDAPPPLTPADLALLTPGSTPASIPAATPASTSDATVPDISVTGLTLGMTEDAARSQLSDYRFATEQALGDPEMTHIAARGTNPDNTYRLAFIGGKLWFVNHMMMFPEGRQPYLPRLIDRLAAKYGKPMRVSQSGTDGYRAWWQFGPDGHPIAKTVSHCLEDATSLPKPARHLASSAGYEVSFTNDCPITLSAMALPDAANPNDVARLEVIMAEPQPVYTHLRAKADDLARQKSAETHLAAGNRP